MCFRDELRTTTRPYEGLCYDCNYFIQHHDTGQTTNIRSLVFSRTPQTRIVELEVLPNVLKFLDLNYLFQPFMESID
jgi:hypothetical protein